MTTQFKLMPGALVALIGLFSSLLPLASAQNPGGYPEWVTNDYDCGEAQCRRSCVVL